MIDATDPIDLLRQRNPIPPGSLYEAAAEQAAGVLAKLRTDVVPLTAASPGAGLDAIYSGADRASRTPRVRASSRRVARSRHRRSVIGFSAASAVALVAAAVVVGLSLSGATPRSAYAAARKALAATTAATSGTMTDTVTHNGREVYTLATTEWNGSNIALIDGTRGELAPIQRLLLVGGSVYAQQTDGSWLHYARRADIGPMLDSMLQLAENNVAGNTADEILRLATGLQQISGPGGSTVYTGTIPHSTVDTGTTLHSTATRVGAPTDDAILQTINSLRIGPSSPGTPGGFHNDLQLQMTVASNGLVRQVSVTYQQQNAASTSGNGTFTWNVAYGQLGSTPPVTAPASSTPASAATTPASPPGTTTTRTP